MKLRRKEAERTADASNEGDGSGCSETSAGGGKMATATASSLRYPPSTKTHFVDPHRDATYPPVFNYYTFVVFLTD